MCTKERRGKERSPRPSPSSFSPFLQHHGSQCATLETGSADRPHAHSRSVSVSKRPAVPLRVNQKTETTKKRDGSQPGSRTEIPNPQARFHPHPCHLWYEKRWIWSINYPYNNRYPVHVGKGASFSLRASQTEEESSHELALLRLPVKRWMSTHSSCSLTGPFIQSWLIWDTLDTTETSSGATGGIVGCLRPATYRQAAASDRWRADVYIWVSMLESLVLLYPPAFAADSPDWNSFALLWGIGLMWG